MPLTVSSFFHYYMVNPRAVELSKKEQVVASVCSTVLGIFTLGIAQIVCSVYANRRFSIFSKDQNESVKKIISATDASLQNTKFLWNIARLANLGEQPTALTLQKLINQHNRISAPLPFKAGIVAVRFAHTPFLVIYDQTGRLALAPEDQKVSLPAAQATDKIIAVADEPRQKFEYLQDIEKLAQNEEPPSALSVQQLIDQHNKISPPLPSKAGAIAVRFEHGPFLVIYDETGRLTLAPQDHKVIEPIEKTHLGEPLAPSQIQQIREIYDQIVTKAPYNKLPYNNIGPCFEFMKFFRRCQKKNPNISLHQAFQIFTPNCSQIVDKYHYGDCVLLAGALQNALHKAGFISGVFGEYAGTSWARPPIPNSASFVWDEYDKATEKAHHCATVIRFSDEQHCDKCLVLETFCPVAIEEMDWETFLTKHTSSDESPDNITNLENTIKKHFSGKYKVVLVAPGNKKVFGIDFLRGNCFLNRAAAKALSGLPCGKNGAFSLSLKDLQHPDEIGQYYIDLKPQSMSHREALHRFSSAARQKLYLPDDFEKNLITLAQNFDTLVKDILLRPIATARQVLAHTEAAERAMAKAKKMATTINANSSTLIAPNAVSSAQHITELYAKLQEAFKQMQHAILADNPDEARQKSEAVQFLSEQMSQHASALTGDPLQISIVENV